MVKKKKPVTAIKVNKGSGSYKEKIRKIEKKSKCKNNVLKHEQRGKKITNKWCIAQTRKTLQ